MEISVRFFTSLREIINKKEEKIEFQSGEKVTVDLVLKNLSHRYSESFIEYVYDKNTGLPKSFLQFLVNGNGTSTREGLETELKDGDVLAILPPVGGG